MSGHANDERQGGRAWRPLLAAAVAIALVGALIGLILITRGDDERVDSVRMDDASRPALEALGRRSPWTEYAATRDWLVVLYAGDMDFPDREPEYAAAPLRGGQAAEFDIMSGGQDTFSPGHLVADDHHALVVGLRCAAPTGETPTQEERFCTSGEPAAKRIDPGSGEVHDVAISPDLRALHGLHVLSSQREDDGWWLVGRLAGQDPGAPPETVLIDATTNRLEIVTRWTGDGTTCITEEYAYQLTTAPGQTGDGPAGQSSPALNRIALADGSVEPVDLPGPAMAPVATLVCTPAGPIFAGTNPGTGGPGLTVHDWHGETWRERPDLVPPGGATPRRDSSLSDRGGAVIAWSVGGAEGPGRRQVITVVPADGSEPLVIDADGGDVWHGSSGNRLGFIHDEDDPGVSTTTLPPGPFPGLDLLPIWS